MKENILQMATEMFLTLGFKSVTMDDIAQKIGISKKTIYSHFPNKNKLVESATFTLFDNICDGINKIIEQGHNPIEEVFRIKKFIIQKVKDERSPSIYQLKKYYTQVHNALMQKQFAMMQECVAENIKRGIEEGYFRTDLDVDLMTRIYFIGISGIKDPNTFPTERFEMNYLLENYIEYHIRGIATTKGIEKLQQIKQQ
ncbi:MAG: TetR/AcrR family transcriptional regulator [Flavicella sp.]